MQHGKIDTTTQWRCDGCDLSVSHTRLSFARPEPSQRWSLLCPDCLDAADYRWYGETVILATTDRVALHPAALEPALVEEIPF